METTKKISDLSRLRNMEVGGEERYPISKLSNVRSMCATYGKMWGRKFETRSDEKEITVRRIS